MAILLLIKASILLAAALGLARLLWRTPAATRHGVWSLAFAALIALPVLAYGLPAIYFPVPAAWQTPASAAPVPAANDAVPATVRAGAQLPRAGAVADFTNRSVASPEGRASTPTIGAAALLLGVWSAGTIVALCVLGLSLARVRRLSRVSLDLTDAAWVTAAHDAARRAGLGGTVRLVTSDDIGTPMAGGLTRPTIFLPSSAPAWSAERRDVVLAHEMSHLARRDPLRHVAARLAVALYWFHPLAWIAAREASVAREQACDEAVLALGTRASAYAQVLLDFAESSPARVPAAALPIVERSLLERRLMAILTDDVRRSARPRPLIPAAAIGVLALALAAARPAAHAPVPDAAAGPASNAAAGSTSPATLRTEPPAPVQAATGIRDEACDAVAAGPFRGTMSSDDRNGRTVVYDMIGTSGADRVVMRSFGDLRVCAIAQGIGDVDDSVRPSDWPARARRVVMETRRAGVIQRLEMTRQAGAAQRVAWFVGGVERPFDPAAQQWREQLTALLDTTWEVSALRGQVSSLRGEISSVRGQESSLRGEISSLTGQVSSMRGQISSVRGEESSLRGQISSIEGHVSSLRGAISSAQGSISALQSSRYGMSDADRAGAGARIKAHEAEIEKLEQEIRDYGAAARIAAVERELNRLDTDKKAAAIEADIRAFNLEGKIDAIERRIRELDVAGKTAGIERSITALDADRRGRQMDDRLAQDLRRLQDAIARIR